jgi:hypothetical protein
MEFILAIGLYFATNTPNRKTIEGDLTSMIGVGTKITWKLMSSFLVVEVLDFGYSMS